MLSRKCGQSIVINDDTVVTVVSVERNRVRLGIRAPGYVPVYREEVVERMVAKPSTPEYGRLSVALQARFAMKKLFNVGSGAFKPPPKVDSAVVRLEPLAQPLQVSEDLLRKAFSARRKTLRNALPGVDFAAAGIDGGLRPENLIPADYARLSMNSIL